VLSVRRFLTSVKPSIFGAAAPSDIHVSYKHRMSIFSYSNSRSSFM
jgi:hypothetical protein